MSNKAIDWDAMHKAAGDAARKVARSYPGIDPEDIEQEICKRALENESTFKRMNYSPAGTFAILVNYGRKYANDERLSALHFSDQYHYTSKEIRKLCGEALFDREAFLASINDEKFNADPEEILARVIDLQDAYGKASEADKALINKRFLGGATLTPAEAKAALRAVDRLTVSVNVGKSARKRTNHDGLGSRQVIPNSAAKALTRKAYE